MTDPHRSPASQPPLEGVRIIDCSILGPGALAMHLADLGAEIIKVEPPGGDPLRTTTWPMVDGVSLMHLHINRSKQSIGLDLRTAEGAEVFEALAAGADAVIEGMRPGALERLGLGYRRLRPRNPALVFCSLSGFGSTGPYRDVPSHGVAFDAWAGLVTPDIDETGRCSIPDHPSIGIHAGPVFGALGVVSAILASRTTGVGRQVEIAQADAAAAMDWLRSETWLAYRRGDHHADAPQVSARRPPGTAGMRDGVRYQFYEASDGRYVLFMASERRFWRNFCEGTGRLDLYDRWPGAERGDHASGNEELHAELRAVFASRTAQQWADLAAAHDTAIVAVNTPESIADDPQFQARFALHPTQAVGTEQLPSPLRFDTDPAPVGFAPVLGQDTDDVLRRIVGLDDDQIAALRASDAIF